jgi:type IV pilus assembly protein PilB
MSARLGEILVKRDLIRLEQLQEALRHQRTQGGRLGSILVQLGFLSDEEIASVLSEQYDLPSVNLDEMKVEDEVKRLIPIETAIRYQVLPLKRIGTALTLAIADPTNVLALDEIKFMTGYRVEPVVASEGSIREAIERNYGSEHTLQLQKVYDELAAEVGQYELELPTDEEVDFEELQKGGTEAPIIKLVNIILGEAIRKGASDIHLEPYEGEFRVRYRIDGVLYNKMNPPLRLRDLMISRLKIMANLDISERRLPQDGRIKIHTRIAGRHKKIDFRVSSLPTLFGEKLVLRILDREQLPTDLTTLGFEAEALKKFQHAIARPYGMVLVTGPTGSGKTSTLYSCLSNLNTESVNIMTAEDPVEFNFPGINQVQTNEQIGLTFAVSLRSFLRQDPNIVMVGEIRDLETAEIAVKAALTGHLVLSTLHTNDAPSTINRLLNMGIEPFLVANSVHLICAQRLVRRICPNCKEEAPTSSKVLTELRFPPSMAKSLKTYHGRGCVRCSESGYKGRVGLFEVMEITPKLQAMIIEGASAADLRKEAKEQGMITLRESGLEKIRSGLTTVEEVIRETTIF